MINKLYEQIKEYIKYNLTFLIFLTAFIIIFNINTGYVIYKSGGSINITDRINKTNDFEKSRGSFNMAYVGMIHGKLPFYLMAKIIPSWEIVDNSDVTYGENETIEDAIKRDQLYLKESVSNAKHVAYLKSGTEFKINKITNNIIYVDVKCDADIKIGDEIIAYDEVEYKDINTLREYIQSKNVGDVVNFEIKRNKKSHQTKATIFETEEGLMIGVAAVSIYDIKSSKEIKVDSKARESGPSGGLILTLAIYEALSGEDLTKGNKIVGTGIMNLNGETGEIGGVKYKLAGAVKDKADLFLVPTDNLEEALDYARKKNYDIIIKGVSNFDEALDVIRNMEAKK